MKGIFVSADILNDPDYLGGRFSKTAARIDLMLMESAGMERPSIRQLANRWRWAVNTVRAFLANVSTDTPTDTETDTPNNLNNTRLYKVSDTAADTPTDTQKNTPLSPSASLSPIPPISSTPSLFPQEENKNSACAYTCEDAEKKTAKTTRTTTVKEILEMFAEEIDRLYKLYPGKTARRDDYGLLREVSTGKSSRDKCRIAGLLKTHTPEQIERSIRMYVEERDGRHLKNFSTFLNNLPEYEDDSPPATEPERVVDF